MPEINQLSRHPVYMDHHATTPLDQRVLDAMLPYFTEDFGNAASVDHIYGARANQAVEIARKQVAKLINAKASEIVFTSGATESDNLAIIGIAEQYANRGKHIITCVTEHKAVLDTCHHLEERGWEVTYLPVDQSGLVNPDDVHLAINPQTVLITIMTANNEIGTIAPIAEIGKIAREHEVLFHTDAAQAVGHIPMDVKAMNIDLLSISAHKIYGPKGVGALYVRKGRPKIRLTEQVHGGGHERGLRSGTLNLPGIVGLGETLEIADKEMIAEKARLQAMREQLLEGLKEKLSEVLVNGHLTQRLPHNLSVALPGFESRSLLIQIKHDVALSNGSACTTAKVEPSHVILALGYCPERAYSSLRFGLGRENKKADINFVVEQLVGAINRLEGLRSG